MAVENPTIAIRSMIEYDRNCGRSFWSNMTMQATRFEQEHGAHEGANS